MNKFVVDFRQAESPGDLAKCIGCEATLINDLIQDHDVDEFYISRKLPKKHRRKHGQYRKVYEARFDLSQAQKALCRRLELFLADAVSEFPFDCVHGFVKGRGIRSNAAVHAGKRHLLRTDIKSFFDSISRERIEAQLQSVGLSPIIASAIGALVTVNGQLAQGVHTSPLLANFVCMNLDSELLVLANDADCSYSRYADDIAISGNEQVPTTLEVSGVLERNGFKLDRTKTRYSKIGQAHFVTGLSISDLTRPRIPKGFKRRLRQEIYYAKKFGISQHVENCDRYSSVSSCINVIDGRISYLYSIEPVLGAKIRKEWNEVLKKEEAFPDYSIAKIARQSEVYFFVDESEFTFQGREVLGLGLTSLVKPNLIRQGIDDIFNGILKDPFSTGRKKKLRKKGLHFTDDSEDTRTKVVDYMSTVPFRFFMAFLDLEEGNYESIYKRVLFALLKDRFAKFFSQKCSITLEETSKVSKSAIQAVVNDVVDWQAKTKRRMLHDVSVEIKAKPHEPIQVLTDYCLAVSSAYVEAPDKEQKRKRFERIRDKVKLVTDLNKQKRYWRNNPW